MSVNMKTAQGKTVSIFRGDHPQTENGPCTSAEEIKDDTVHEVAAKVVENVVRLASQATQGNFSSEPRDSHPAETPAAAATTSGQKRSSTQSAGSCVMFLPTIQIDTVPSMPPSPDWSPPPEEDSFQEEALDETQIEIQFGAVSKEAPENIKEFAASYVQDLILKAKTIVEQKLATQDAAQAQVVAAHVVDEVIAKATETANERLQNSPVVTMSNEIPEFPSVPSIQIDTVASMPSSPTEWNEEEEAEEESQINQEPLEKDTKELPRIKFRVTVEDEDKIAPALVKFSQAPEEMKEFVASYVKDIMTKAISMAEEKFVPTVPFNFEDVNLMKASGPWYIRAREALMRLLRTACFCTPRRNES